MADQRPPASQYQQYPQQTQQPTAQTLQASQMALQQHPLLAALASQQPLPYPGQPGFQFPPVYFQHMAAVRPAAANGQVAAQAQQMQAARFFPQGGVSALQHLISQPAFAPKLDAAAQQQQQQQAQAPALQPAQPVVQPHPTLPPRPSYVAAQQQAAAAAGRPILMAPQPAPQPASQPVAQLSSPPPPAVELVLPLAKVKRLIKQSSNVKAISGEGSFAIARATELLLEELADRAAAHMRSESRDQLEYTDVARAVNEWSATDFLADIVPEKVTVAELVERAKQAREAADAEVAAAREAQAAAIAAATREAEQLAHQQQEAYAGESNGPAVAAPAPAPPAMMPFFHSVAQAIANGAPGSADSAPPAPMQYAQPQHTSVNGTM